MACYWFQVIKNRIPFGSQDVNSELKHLGCGVSNVTSVFTRLKEKKPALLMQVAKAGTSQQARKKYQLTVPGLQRVKGMIGGSRAGD